MKAFINKWLKPAEEGEHPVRPNLFNQLRNTAAKLNERSKWILPSLLAGAWFLLWLVIVFTVHHQSNAVTDLTLNENKRALTILNQLSDINDELQQLAASPQNSANFKMALTTISSDLSVIQQSVGELAKSSDVQKVSGQLAAMQTDVDAQMLDLKRAVASGDGPKQYLDPKALPFHVISIDVISQQPFISIDYANHITPLAVGDTVAGWKITAADYDAAQVEFKNDHDQYVKVSLQGQ